jgi:hypothetical protein
MSSSSITESVCHQEDMHTYSNKKRKASIVSSSTDKAPYTPRRNKRSRFIWGEDLRKLFIAAILDVGLSNTTPETILEMRSDRSELHSSMQTYLSSLKAYRTDVKLKEPCLKGPLGRFEGGPKINDIKSATDELMRSMIPTTKRKHTKSVKSSPTLAPLSMEALHQLQSNHDVYSFKEFPHLKDIHYAPPVHTVEVTSNDASAMNLTRPYSPISSDIDSYDFDWAKEDFDSTVIKLFLNI